jgi:cytochrome c
MMTRIVIVATMLVAGTGVAAAQDVAAGETSFKKCLACHEIGDGAKNKVGPELNGLDGRKTGSVDGYNYSDANKSSGVVWNESQFLDYIKDPRKKIVGTKMFFPGIKNETEAKNLWGFLKQFGPDGKTK